MSFAPAIPFQRNTDLERIHPLGAFAKKPKSQGIDELKSDDK